MSASEILDCLRLETQAMRELLAELKLQQQALISGTAHQLQQQSQRCQQQIQKLEALSQERQRLQAELTEEAEGDLMASDQAQIQTKIKICQHMLLSQVQELQRFQSQNQGLIAQAQSVNETSLEALLQLQRQDNPAVYTASGASPEWSTVPSVYDYNA